MTQLGNQIIKIFCLLYFIVLKLTSIAVDQKRIYS